MCMILRKCFVFETWRNYGSRQIRTCTSLLLNKSEYLKLAKANINIHNQTIVSSNCYFNEPTLVYGSCYLYRIKMDSYSYINYSSDVQNSSIGRYCCIGSNCNIGMPFHNYKAFSSSNVCNSQSGFLRFSGPIDYMPQWLVWCFKSFEPPYEIV